MKIKPRNEHVVIKVIPARDQRGGIIVPGQETERSLVEIVAVGQGGLTVEGKRMPIEVDDGQPLTPGMLVFMRGGEYETFLGDDKSQCMIVPQSAIIGVEIDSAGEIRTNLN